MELAFNSKILRDICESEQNAIDALGFDETRRLKILISELEAAENVYETINGKLTFFENSAMIKLDTCEVEFVPPKSLFGLDWLRINRIKIVRIGEIENDNS